MTKIYKENGDAGTGKTSTAVNRYQGAYFCAPTNKAADVLNQKFKNLGATTIHSGLYHPNIIKFEDIEVKVTNPDGTFVRDKKGTIVKRTEQKPVFEWTVSNKSPIMSYDTVVIDEASMIASREAYELVSNYPGDIILIGDEKQLKPVDPNPIGKYQNWFHTLPTNYTHTTNYRQQAGSYIITAALDAFKHKIPANVSTADCEIDLTNKVTPAEIAACQTDKVLCFKNTTRTTLNREIRKKIYGQKISFDYPQKGEILVAEHKQKGSGLKKGAEYQVKDYAINGKQVDLSLQHIHTNELVAITQKQGTFNEVSPTNALTSWAYAQTVHKSQGSEWDKVIIADDTNFVLSDLNHWYYTGMTRAKSQIIVVKV